MLRAIIFDFDGVIADSEFIHFSLLRHVLGDQGISLSKEEYYSSYLGFDDRECFYTALTNHGRSAPPDIIDELVKRKSVLFFNRLKDHPVVYPGVPELIREAALHLRLAIASGALRQEIEFVLEHSGLRKEFQHITSAEDVSHGKPNPESFLHAMASLNTHHEGQAAPLVASECLVIEDSIPGVHAAHSAGMKVVAVANTLDVEALRDADVVVQTMSALHLSKIQATLWGNNAS